MGQVVLISQGLKKYVLDRAGMHYFYCITDHLCKLAEWPWEISAVFQPLAAYSLSLHKPTKFLKPAEDLNEILLKKKSSQSLNLIFEINVNIKYSILSFLGKKNSYDTLQMEVEKVTKSTKMVCADYRVWTC